MSLYSLLTTNVNITGRFVTVNPGKKFYLKAPDDAGIMRPLEIDILNVCY
jgi:hypothetical protein